MSGALVINDGAWAQRSVSFLSLYYRVIFLIVHQEQGCCELIFALLRSPKASMCPQDRAQITFW